MTWPHDASLPSLQRISDAHACLVLEHSTQKAISDWQSQRTTELLNWLTQHVPWWNARLCRAGVALRWADIPVLNRAELRNMVNEYGVAAMPSHHGGPIAHHLSASEGAGVGFYTSSYHQRMVLHAFYADHQRQGRNPFARQACISDEVPAHRGSHTEMQPNLEAGCGEQLFRRGELFSALQHMGWLSEVKPDYLTVDSKWMDALVASAKATCTNLPEVHQILTHGTVPAHETRTLARRLFAAIIKYRYTLAECGPLAFQCPRNDDFLHVAVANAVVEVENDDSEPVTEIPGRVLVTALHQYATPVVRYEVGDYAVLHRHCPGCGLAVPTLSDLQQNMRI